MNINKTIKSILAENPEFKKMADDFLEGVLIPSFGVKKVPITVETLNAYYVGFVQGAESKNKSMDGVVTFIIEKIIDDKTPKPEKKEGEKDVKRIPPHTCTCGYVMDATMEMDEQVVDHMKECEHAEGHLSLCAKCSRVWIFKDDFTMREPTAEEEAEYKNNPEVTRARAMINMIRNGAK